MKQNCFFGPKITFLLNRILESHRRFFFLSHFIETRKMKYFLSPAKVFALLQCHWRFPDNEEKKEKNNLSVLKRLKFMHVRRKMNWFNHAYRLRVSGKKRQHKAPAKLKTPRMSDGNALKNVAWEMKNKLSSSTTSFTC